MIHCYSAPLAGTQEVSSPLSPSRNLPLAVAIGLSLVIISYVLVNLAFFAVLPYKDILSAEAVALVREQ